jgi:hypothetical protein
MAAIDEIQRNTALLQRRFSMALETLIESAEAGDKDETERIRVDLTVLTTKLLTAPGWKVLPMREATQHMHSYDAGTQTDPRAGWIRDLGPSIRCLSCGMLR